MTETTKLAIPVTNRDHVLGPPDAAVTLVEYGDYECPHCGKAHPIVREIKRRMGDELRFAYRHFPLSEIHPYAALAAQAAEAAGAQKRFWEMHDMLFEHQNRLTLPDLVQYARSLGLNEERFEAELITGAYVDRVTQDFLGGIRSGVGGTPTFFINGIRHLGSFDLPDLLAAIEAAADQVPKPSAASINSFKQFRPNLGG